MTAGTGVGVGQTAGEAATRYWEIFDVVSRVTTVPGMSEQVVHARQVSVVTAKSAALAAELHEWH
ncbi:hypothetical protein [Mycobacterium sp. URHB0021]|jgi:hypothetical protein